MKRNPALLRASLTSLCMAGCGPLLLAQVTISGPVYVDSGSVVSVHDNLYYGSNAYQVLADGSRLEFKGNMLQAEDGAVLHGFSAQNPQSNGQFVFNRAVHQVIEVAPFATGPVIAGNLVLDNPSGITLAQGTDLKVSNSLEFVQGYLSAGISTVTFAANAAIAGAAPGRGIALAPAGRVKKEGLAPQNSFAFPVGIAPSDYAPAILVNEGGSSDDFTVGIAAYSQLPPGLLSTPEAGMDRAWNISSAYGNGASVSLQHSAVLNGSSYDDATAYVSRYDGSSWESCNGCAMTYMPAGPSGYAQHSRSYVFVPNTGADNWFTKMSGSSPLPVTLTAWSASCAHDGVMLRWATGAEKNNAYFTLYRSRDAQQWTALGRVEAGKEGGLQQYQFLDRAGENHYYRLQQTDKDGTAAFASEIIRASCTGAMQWALQVYPNPATDAVVLSANTDEPYSLSVYDVNGRVLLQQQVYNSRYKLTLADWLPGVYMLRTQTGSGRQQTVRLVKYNR